MPQDKGTLSRRRTFQLFSHLEKALTLAYDLRDEARKLRHLDDVGNLTETIFHLKRSMAYLNIVSKRRWSKAPEDLKGYK